MTSKGHQPFKTFASFVALVALASAAPVFADSDDRGRRKSLTGVWLTRPAAPFVLQDPDSGVPDGTQGRPVKEATLMRWELEEDENGLITGYNTYYSQAEDGSSQSRGTLCMVGAQIGSRVILTESYAIYDGVPVPQISTTAIFAFDCEQRGRNNMRCIGHGLSNIQPTALQANLVRSKRAGDIIPVPEAAREICQPD